MESSDIKLIFSDIDGTLLNSNHIVTEKTRQAIAKVVEEGRIFIPVSARMPGAIQPIMESIGIHTPIISFNGALIEDGDGQVLSSQTLPIDRALAVIQEVETEQPAIAWNVYRAEHWYVADPHDSWVKREADIVGVSPNTIERADLERLESVHKLLLMGDPAIIGPFEHQLKAYFPELSIAQSAPYFIEIMAPGIEKGKAVEAFARMKQVPLEATMAFGDNYNDLDMLRVVGHPYVMGNAPEAIKAEFEQITLDHNHDGIAVVLEEMASQDEH